MALVWGAAVAGGEAAAAAAYAVGAAAVATGGAWVYANWGEFCEAIGVAWNYAFFAI